MEVVGCWLVGQSVGWLVGWLVGWCCSRFPPLLNSCKLFFSQAEAKGQSLQSPKAGIIGVWNHWLVVDVASC